MVGKGEGQGQGEGQSQGQGQGPDVSARACWTQLPGRHGKCKALPGRGGVIKAATKAAAKAFCFLVCRGELAFLPSDPNVQAVAAKEFAAVSSKLKKSKSKDG